MRRTALVALWAALATVPAIAWAGDSVRATSSGGRCSAKAAPAGSRIELPPLTGRVVDEAHILGARSRDMVARRLAALETRTRDQLVVVTLASLRGPTIEDYGMALGNGWGIGQKALNNGVLLIIAPTEHKVRIEVGCGLEGLLTPRRSAGIVRAPLLPLLKQRRYDAAAEAGVARIAAVLEGDTRRPQPARESAR